MSWGTSLLILNHCINWVFDPHLCTAPPVIPQTNLQPELSVFAQLPNIFRRLDEMLRGSLGARDKMSSHTSWSPALMQLHYGMIFHTLPRLTGDSLHHCGSCCCCFFWCLVGSTEGRTDVEKELGEVYVAGKGKQALFPTSSHSVSASMFPCYLRNKSGSENWFKSFLIGIK